MTSLNQLLADELIDREIDIARLEAYSRRQALRLLHDLRSQLEDRVRAARLDPTSVTSYKLRRMEQLIRDASNTIDSNIGEIKRGVNRQIREIGSFVASDTTSILNGVIGVDLFRVTLTSNDVRSLADNQVLFGGPLRDWWRKQSTSMKDRFAREVRMGVAAGETNDQLIRRIRGVRKPGTKVVGVGEQTKTVVDFGGGWYGKTTNEVEGLVRTSVQSISNDVLMKTYAENADILRAVQSVVTFDARTTITCISRGGGVWDILTGEALPESETDESFPGPPPWHMRCRTALAPVTRSWEDMIRESSGVSVKLTDSVPTSVRASMDGKVAGDLSYLKWAERKGDAFLRSKFGPARYELWKSGKITPAQLIDQSGRPLSVRELQHMIDSGGSPRNRRAPKPIFQ